MNLSQVDIHTKQLITNTIGNSIDTNWFFNWITTTVGRQYTVYNGSDITNLETLKNQRETFIKTGIVTKVFQDGNRIYIELNNDPYNLEFFDYKQFTGICTHGYGMYYVIYPNCTYHKLHIQ
ncbi:hypothetical protein P9X10_02385 [Bacillus cereus]|nr:hypothetical protein [Bacillus cereus]